MARLRDATFAIVVTEISDREVLTRLDQQVQEAIADLHMAALGNRKIKANIGLAMYPIDGYSDEDLLTSARNAVLYRTSGEQKRQAEPQTAVVQPAEAVSSVGQSTPPAPSAVVDIAVSAAVPMATGQTALAVPAEPVESQVEASLAQLHCLIGQYLQAENSSAEKHAQALKLIGEFKRRA